MKINSRLFCAHAAATLLAALVVVLLCPRNGHAQGSRVAAALEGSIKDGTGGAISGAAVVVLNTATNQARNLETNDEGFFHAEALPVGVYEIRVDRAGFASYRQKEIDLTLGQTSRIDVVLVPAGISEEVNVTAQQQTFDVSQASVVSPVDRERIEELPVQSRNSLDFVLLAPGVLSAPPAPPVPGGLPLSSSGFTFGGLRARSNNISIDGLDNNDEYTGSGRTELSPEIVQEFQVVQNGLSAESGGASGGSINVITRSGANAIHGDAFIFAQDAFFNARDPFESDPAKPSFRRFREGVSLGGPVVKDRTFYYVAVEQEHNRGQNGSEIDPAVAASINSFLATGAFPGIATRQIITNFFPTSRAETEAAGKLDHQLTKNTALMLRYAFTNNREAGDAYNTGGLTDISARGSSFIADNSLSGSLTTVFGSNAVGDLRFQAATRHAVLRPTQPNGPEINIAGIVDFGRPYAGLSDRRENHYQADYTYTRLAGKNIWKAGVAVAHVSLRASAADGFGGVYLFNTLQDFLSAHPAQFRQAFGNPTVNLPVANFGGFAQDHYSLTSSVSADFGVRYDFEKLPFPFNQATHNFSPRVGLAWAPSSRWAVRAGYGIFFDRYILADLAQAMDMNGSQGFVQVADAVAAANLFLISQGGPQATPAPGIAPSIFRADPHMATPYSQQASAGVEHQVSKFISVRADFLFVRGVDLSRTLNINLLPPIVLTPANAVSLGVVNPTPQQIGRQVFSPARANSAFDDIYQLSNSATSTYKGVSFTLNRRMNDELAFSASYTLSRTVDDASDFNEQPQNPFQLAQENARSLQNQLHRFVFNALWELPIGDEEDKPADQHGQEGWLTRTFSHIEVAPIFTATSGHDENPLTGLDSNLTHAFPLSSRPLDLQRNSLQTASTVNMDFRLLKYFPFGESRHLDVVAEFFNLFNHPNVLENNPVFGSGQTPIAGFGAPIEGMGARQVQFSLDFEF
ncbi:MAG TPA: TonB-dependent receptor [Candidatus Saccharimonadales bacterium]|nr:TonB-dependent receptor [Candidatus Saccharimonadales bacterium]